MSVPPRTQAGPRRSGSSSAPAPLTIEARRPPPTPTDPLRPPSERSLPTPRPPCCLLRRVAGTLSRFELCSVEFLTLLSGACVLSCRARFAGRLVPRPRSHKARPHSRTLRTHLHFTDFMIGWNSCVRARASPRGRSPTARGDGVLRLPGAGAGVGRCPLPGHPCPRCAPPPAGVARELR